MNLTDDLVLKFQKGGPILFDDICAVYSLTIGEIVDVGYSNFQKYLSVLTATKPVSLHNNELKDAIAELTDFQYIMMMVALDPTMNQTFKLAFKFFTKEEVNFSLDPAQLVVGPIEEKHIITEEKFYEFQALLRHMYFIDVDVDDIVINADDDPAVKRLKMQMRENREKVKLAKAKQAAREKRNDLQFSDLLASVTINGCGLNMENIWNVTYYAFHDQLKRMGWRDQFEINSRAALAGAKLKKDQLKHWMRSIANSEQS